MTFFRYRPYYSDNNHLIDELKNNYMYFAPSSSENDINEGHPTFCFNGNKELWKGLFRYFYFCVYSNMMGYHISNIIKDAKYTSKFFLNDPVINHIIKLLSISGTFYSDLIKNILMEIYNLCEAYISINDVNIKDNLNRASKNLLLARGDLYIKSYDNNRQITNLLYNNIHNHSKFKLFIINFSDIVGYDLGSRSNHYNRLRDFITSFLGKLFRLSIPDSYIVSLTTKVNNDEMWANYANKYCGICIEYKCTNNYFRMYNKKYTDFKNLTLHNVNYVNKFPKYNFFRYLDITNDILKNIFVEVFHDNSQFRMLILNNKTKAYYKKQHECMCINSVNTKNRDWLSERELRLIRMGNNIQDNKLYYRFSQIKSVTFGSRLPNNIQNDIIKILRNKCKYSHIHNFHIYKMRRTNNSQVNRVPLITINTRD